MAIFGLSGVFTSFESRLGLDIGIVLAFVESYWNSIAGRSGLDLKDQLGPVFRVVLTNILFVFFTQCYRSS
jgi:hypothetical protein